LAGRKNICEAHKAKQAETKAITNRDCPAPQFGAAVVRRQHIIMGEESGSTEAFFVKNIIQIAVVIAAVAMLAYFLMKYV